jgi:hypothetical protein
MFVRWRRYATADQLVVMGAIHPRVMALQRVGQSALHEQLLEFCLSICLSSA